MIETSAVPPQKSSATFGNLQKMFEKCSETFVKPSAQFWKIFRNLQKVVKNIVISMFISSLWIRILSSHVQLDISLVPAPSLITNVCII